MVCSVGINSTRGIVDPPLNLNQDTPVQDKLENLAKKFSYFAIMVCLVVMVLFIIMIIVNLAGDLPWYKVLFQHSLRYMNILVVLFVVIVPEGLPMTIGVSLAFTTGRMHSEDRILVKDLDAPEKMGEVNEILCGKTSTITTGEM